MVQRVCFTDVDGTLVHYPEAPATPEEVATGEMITLPPSSTNKQGVISLATLRKAAQLREAGVLLAIVSGARTSTIFQRLPYLPASDAIVSENACPLREDLVWRLQHELVAGPHWQEAVPPGSRQGTLWSFYQQLASEGWKVDAVNYSTCFRLQLTEGRTLQELNAAIARKPAEISCTFNLGVADFYPATSGKVKAGEYLMQTFGAKAADCVFLCDDDNDLELAAIVHKAFLPSVTSETVSVAIAEHPERFVVAKEHGTAASEEMLDAVALHYALRGSEAVVDTPAINNTPVLQLA